MYSSAREGRHRKQTTVGSFAVARDQLDQSKIRETTGRFDLVGENANGEKNGRRADVPITRGRSRESLSEHNLEGEC